MKKPTIKDALSGQLLRPLDPANLSNDAAVLRNLVGQLNTAPRGMEGVPVDKTEYSGPVGAGNTTIVLDSIPHETASSAPPPPPDETPVPIPLKGPSPLGKNRRFVFTGRAVSQIIAALGAKEFSLTSSARQLASIFFPSAKGDSPGFQDFVDTVYAWGTGEVSTDYPATPERAVFQMLVRSIAGALPKGTNWISFGTNPGFWTDTLVNAAKTFFEENPQTFIVFTGIPDHIALRYFQGLGFVHWHVTGRPGTALALDPLSSTLDQEVIKTLSGARSGPKLRCIWGENSPPMPRLWSVQEFLSSMR